MILPQIQIARAHWALGALFLAIILEEYVPVRDRSGRVVQSRSPLVGWALMLGGVGAWATTVFADVVHDMVVHSLWGDILFAAGALELARRRGVYERPWLDWVLPAAFFGCGLLFLAHIAIHPSGQGVNWHLAMGVLLILGALLEINSMGRPRSWLIALSVAPLIGFALVLIAIPVAAAS